MTGKMGYKTYAKMTDLASDFVNFPSDETDRSMQEFQDSIGWPWSATREQLDSWSESWKHHWDENLAATINAQKTAGVWPARTRAEAVEFAKMRYSA